VLVGAVSLFHLPAGVVTVGLVFGVPASFLLANGWLGIRLETKADDYAAEVVGPDALRRGLDCLAQLNMTKRRSGPVWNLLTQHPGVQQRLDRLAVQESRTGQDMPAPTKRDDASGDRRENVVAATRTRS
jgi:Zn-dependent protease with chaperone function